MSETKVSLYVKLPGRVMYSKEECIKEKKERIVRVKGKKTKVVEEIVDNDKLERNTLELRNEGEVETYTYYTRKSRPASQTINLTKEAYDYMTDRNSCPEWSKAPRWVNMNKKERLELHLKNIMEQLGGVSFSYKVLDE